MSGTCTSNPYYVVLSIPLGAPDINVYNNSSTSAGFPGCSTLEFCYTKSGSTGCKCVAMVYGDPSVPNSKTFSVYQYMGGDPNNPSSAGYKLIPCVGGKYPINYVGAISNMTSYATIVSGGNTLSGLNDLAAAEPYIILAYDTCWIQSWEDLNALAPPNPPSNNNKFLNTQTNYASNTIFYFAGTQLLVPTIESQFAQLLGTFCSQVSTICQYEYGFCSNFFSNIPNNLSIQNYCSSAYQKYLSNESLYPTTIGKFSDPTADTTVQVGNAIGNYCKLFPENSPAECDCINRGQIQDFNLFAKGLGSESPIGCWWYPCKTDQGYLIDYITYNGARHCPNVCQAVFEIMGKNDININNSNITQYLSCCDTGKNSTNTCCSDPTQSSCSKAPPNPSAPTFWKKYGLLIIITIIIILVLAVVIGIIIYTLNRKK